MAQSSILLNQVWTKLSNAMERMFQLQSVTRNEYMDLYNSIHNYFMSTEYNTNLLNASLAKPKVKNETDKKNDQSDKKKDQPDKKPDQPDSTEDDSTIPGSDLYFNLKTFLLNYLLTISGNENNRKGEDFLRFYAKTWEKYQFLCLIINGIFSSMNNGWVARQREIGHKNIHDVYIMAMHIWQDIFFKEANQSLTQTCLSLIKDDRDGIRIDSRLIRQVVQSYVSVGFIEAEQKNKNNRAIGPALTVYNVYFEKQFLQTSEQFYQLESNDFLEKYSTSDYLKKITKRLKEEEGRVKDCLHPTTAEKLQPKLEEILIKNQLDIIYVEALKLLREEKIEDLRIVFDLVNRIDKANEPIQASFKTYVLEVGTDVITRKSDTAIKDPKIYVETLIEIHTRFFKIVTEGFVGEQGYNHALDKACSKLVNDNAVTQEAKKSSKSSELLARYCDLILRKGNKTEGSDVEEKLNEIMVVFNYIDDKDVFQKFYGKLLAKRLVGQSSASDDYEESMISKLKAVCGFEFASKLQRMFQDIRLSTTLIEEYKIDCENEKLTNIVDFPVMVLTSNSWPFTPPSSFTLPAELESTFLSFTKFYTKKKFTGRKLEWLHQHSKGELQTSYTKQKYTFQVSAYQMAILLLFNKAESMTVERIFDATRIESGSFMQILLTLLKSKVLTCSEISGDQLNDDLKDSDIQKNYTIQVDESFKSKRIKINLNLPIRSVEQKETETVNQSIEEDRKILTQAAIVRIMKARKELRHASLIQEVIPQLAPRFQPHIPMIKKCIDILIEKDYLARDPKERDLFRYKA